MKPSLDRVHNLAGPIAHSGLVQFRGFCQSNPLDTEAVKFFAKDPEYMGGVQ